MASFSNPAAHPAPSTASVQVRAIHWCVTPALALIALTAGAQQQPKPIASVSTAGVSLAGSLSVANGRAVMANNSQITAGEQTAEVSLTRGGTLKICASTGVHLSRDAAAPQDGTNPSQNTPTADDAGLMVALDRGAIEAHYTAGRYSDVILTPDLRILISGPGETDLALRVNRTGDTCVDNHGPNAPYVTVTSLLDGGLYRVQPNQRVMFEHGSLDQVVDREADPCGCPAAPAVETASNAKTATAPATPPDTAFPLAVSEGLENPPPPPTTPVVPAGQPHAQVTAVFSNDTPPGPPPADEKPQPVPPAQPAPATPQSAPNNPARQQNSGFFHSFGRFFSHLFGG